MADLLQTGMTMLNSQLASYAAQTVTINRGSTSVSGITVTIGRTPVETESTEGVIVRSQVQDFLLAAADYDFGAGAVEPERHDYFTWEDPNGVTHRYDVLPLGDEQEYWRYCDPHRTRLRIHTKRVGVVN